MICKRCGANVPEGTKFCMKCGLELPVVQLKPNPTVTQSVPKAKKTAVKPKKTIPGWLIAVLIFVLIVIVAVGVSSSESSSGSSSSGSPYIGSTPSPYEGKNSYEKELIETLPRDLTSYVLQKDNCVHTLEVTDFCVERHSENGISDTADCTIVLEDAYMKMTSYVTLNSRKYDTGWVVESWGEIQNPVLIPKYEPDMQEMQTSAKGTDFKSFITLTDSLDLNSGIYEYVCSVNDTYEYISYSGTISLKSEFVKVDYDRVEELNKYGWDYKVEEKVKANWNIFGEWKVEEHYNLLTGYWVLSLQSFDGEPAQSTYSNVWRGNYRGYDVRTYRTWDHSINNYTNNFQEEEPNYNGMYEITDLYKPQNVKMTIYGPSGYGIEIFADKAIGYSDMSSYGSTAQEGVLTFNRY